MNSLVLDLLFSIPVGLLHSALVFHFLDVFGYESISAPRSQIQLVIRMVLVGAFPAVLFLHLNLIAPSIAISVLLALVLTAERRPSEGEPLGAIYLDRWLILIIFSGMIAGVELVFRGL